MENEVKNPIPEITTEESKVLAKQWVAGLPDKEQ